MSDSKKWPDYLPPPKDCAVMMVLGWIRKERCLLKESLILNPEFEKIIRAIEAL